VRYVLRIDGSREAGHALHRAEASGVVVLVKDIDLQSHALAVLGANSDPSHSNQVLVARIAERLAHQLAEQLAGYGLAGAGLDRLVIPEAEVQEHLHLLAMAGEADGLVLVGLDL